MPTFRKWIFIDAVSINAFLSLSNEIIISLIFQFHLDNSI